MANGSCLCGTVQWAASGELTAPSHCHCSMCRKANGAPFVTFTSSAVEDFEWTSGEGNVVRYESSPGLIRGFCKTCGSSVPGTTPGNGRVFIPLGCMDGETGLKNGRHIFVASKASWHTIAGDLEQHDTYPSGPGMHSDLQVYDSAVLDAPTSSGVLRGSCLCNAIKYEVKEPFSVIHNCHCSRCRKARGAAHATNGFVPLDAVKFLEGEELIVTYRLPEAKSFGQAFCSTCGSAVPRINKEAKIVGVPLGPLDDMTDDGPRDHIFVGSMADWYQIEDDIIQFLEGPR